MDDVRPSGDLISLLARRLDGHGPLGVAVSGGGDSVALLYRLAEWGRRPLHVFCVDHGLNPASGAWTQGVADHAARVGADFTPLRWTGPKPATGLSAAARAARHALLADAARAAGVRVLCLAHTRDDVLEAGWMREHGSNVTAPVEWGPSPAWPQGRGVFLLRPLLDVGRESLRHYLKARGVGWIDDPANANPQSLRAQARLADKAEPVSIDTPSISRGEMDALLDRRGAAHGLIILRRAAFEALPPAVAHKVLAAAAVCAGGGDRLPRRDRVEALRSNLAAGMTRTMCGARIWQDDDYLYLCREAGDIGRAGTGRVALIPGEEAMWDGRYAIRTDVDGAIEPSGRVRARLGEADRTLLLRLPPALRGILPVFDEHSPERTLSNARLLGQTAETGVNCVNWVVPRFVAACGAVDRESRIGLDFAML